MHAMISKYTISNCTRFAEVIFYKMIKQQFLYTPIVIIGSPTRVGTKKGSKKVSGVTQKFTPIEGVTKESIAPGSNNVYTYK